MKTNASFIRIILLITAIVLAFSCDDTGDQREETRKALGEPDDKIINDYSSFKSELWVYARRDINRVYEYRQSAAGCGGSGEWYLFRRFLASGSYAFDYELYDPPPVINHSPILSAVTGESLIIKAQVTLHPKAEVDAGVKRVDLDYRSPGDSLSTFIVMSLWDEEEQIYIGEIPGVEITENGLEYSIKAISNDSTAEWFYWSYLPAKNRFYKVEVSADSTGQVEKAGHADTTLKESDFFTLPEPGVSPGRTSPISP